MGTIGGLGRLMRIASHHVKGTDKHRLSQLLRPAPEYTPVCAWPEDCTVQWGNGIIPAVPFFEAFIPGTFIRGEGDDLTTAEQNAFAKYQRDIACEHIWGRQRPNGVLYTNGAGWCRKCGGFRSNMFKPLVILGHMRKPLTISEADFLHDMETDHEMNEHMDRTYPEDRESRRKLQRTLRLRMNLFGMKPRT